MHDAKNSQPKTTLLCILDGFGLNPNPEANAVALAKKPNFDKIWSSCPHSTLVTHGERVGLPDGQMGNSEVGHLNIGAGRVVEQWLLRINRALSGTYLDSSVEYKNWLSSTKNSKVIHLIGLYSDGGVHSHNEHLLLLLKRLSKDTKAALYIHLITDGRDTATDRSLEQVAELESRLASFPQAKIASVSGRYYAMDRDKRWDRTELAYKAIAEGAAPLINSAIDWLKESQAKGTTDEFILPRTVIGDGINSDDGILFWNFREDRMRQIVAALAVEDFSGFKRTRKVPEHSRVLCFTDYDHTFHLPSVFPLLEIKNQLGEVVAAHGLKQLRVAETEKYPHVTYFFNGGIETPSSGESRKVLPSPRDVKTYDLKPEMAAADVADTVEAAILSKEYALIVANFANCDMVGHTGVLSAAIKAVEVVDGCLGRLLRALETVSGQAIIIADHGNAEQMVNYEDGTPHTTHTKYPVPIVLVGADKKFGLCDNGALCDVAPSILEIMDLPTPSEMTGKSLIKK